MSTDLSWNLAFETGIEMIDAKHRQMMELLNVASPLLLAPDGIKSVTLQRALNQLLKSAESHLDDARKLMASCALAPEFVSTYEKQVYDFIAELRSLLHPVEGDILDGATRLRFLTNLLTYQILDAAQMMAAQIRLIKQGSIATDALMNARNLCNPAANELMQQILPGLCQSLAARNRGLRRLVDERTREIVFENEQLTAALGKMEQAQSQLLQSEKMASIGQLAAGVAHEINNPVGYVNSNLGTLKTYVGRLLEILEIYTELEPFLKEAPELKQRLADAKAKADLEYLRTDVLDLLHESEDGLARVRRIVSDLKDFSHVDSVEWQEVDINAGLESTLNVVWNEIKYKAEVVKEYGQLPLVRCVGGQINQVIMNLLVNAAQAIEERGYINIGTRTEGDQVVIEISDTGKGISPDSLSRIFEPFFTTKPVGKGTGLGLSIAWDIVHKHGGSIVASSEKGQGTTFKLTLPVAGPVPD